MVSAIVAMTNIFCFDVFDCGGGAFNDNPV